MRAYLIAFGLTALVLGVPLLFAGEVGIGCSISGQGGNARLSDCSGAQSLILGGEILVLAAVVLFAASFVPSSKTQYR